MNTQKSVYNRLFSKKTELETHKVKLGLVQDVEKALNVREEGKDIFDRGMAVREDLIDAAKDLGLNAKDVKGFTELDKILDVLEKDFQDLLRSIK